MSLTSFPLPGSPAIVYGTGAALSRIVLPTPVTAIRMPGAPHSATTVSIGGRVETTWWHTARSLIFVAPMLRARETSLLRSFFYDWAIKGLEFRYYPVHDGDSFHTCIATPGWSFEPEPVAGLAISTAAFSFRRTDILT
jgi:hypothetical protein